MSIFEDSENEIISYQIPQISELHTTNKTTGKSSVITHDKGKDKPKQSKTQNKKEITKETKLSNNSRKKDKEIVNKVVVDLENPDNTNSFMENIIQEIKINKLSKFDEKKKLFANEFFGEKKFKTKTEEFYDFLFKNNNKYNNFITEIEENFIEQQNCDSIFKLYHELMKVIEKNDYDLVKNVLFYMLIKDLESRCNNVTIGDLHQLKDRTPEKKEEDKLTMQINKKRKRSLSQSKEKPLRNKTKKSKEKGEMKKKSEQSTTIKQHLEKEKCTINKQGKEKVKEKNKKKLEKSEFEEKKTISKEKTKTVKKKIYDLEMGETVIKMNKTINKNDKTSSKKALKEPSTNGLNNHSNILDLKIIEETNLENDKKLAIDPLQDLIQRNTSKYLQQDKKSYSEIPKQSTSQESLGWNFHISSSSLDEEKEKPLELVDFSSDSIIEDFKSR